MFSSQCDITTKCTQENACLGQNSREVLCIYLPYRDKLPFLFILPTITLSHITPYIFLKTVFHRLMGEVAFE